MVVVYQREGELKHPCVDFSFPILTTRLQIPHPCIFIHSTTFHPISPKPWCHLLHPSLSSDSFPEEDTQGSSLIGVLKLESNLIPTK